MSIACFFLFNSCTSYGVCGVYIYNDQAEFGGYIFGDSEFAETTVSYTVNQSNKDIQSLGAGFSLKIPVSLSGLILFPLANVEYQLILSGTETVNSFGWIRFGGGFDFHITNDFYLRGEGMYAPDLSFIKYINMMDFNPTAGYSVRLAFGWRQGVSTSSSQRAIPENTSQVQSIAVNAPSVSNDYIPRYAFETAEEYRRNFLREHYRSASDLRYRFFYNGNGEACLEYTLTPKGGYTWSNTVWRGHTWGNMTGSIGNNAVTYTLTRRMFDEAQLRMEERRRDPVFREIERIVLQIATDYDYDFGSAYGIRVRYRNPNVRRAVCDGYSDAVLRAFANHPHVLRAEKWSSSIGNHAWNVLVLKDGRRLFVDATWYDGNTIDDEGYVVNIPAQQPTALTFDINEFNSSGGAINNATGRLLETHFAWRDARRM
jgi:hypothetical protein